MGENICHQEPALLHEFRYDMVAPEQVILTEDSPVPHPHQCRNRCSDLGQRGQVVEVGQCHGPLPLVGGGGHTPYAHTTSPFLATNSWHPGMALQPDASPMIESTS